MSTLAVVVALSSVIATRPARADLSVYVTGLNNEFGTLDLATGSFNPIGTLNLPAGDYIDGLGYGSDGNLYGLDSGPNSILWQINPSNGIATDVGSVGPSVSGATSDASGTFYAISQDVGAIYFTLNPPSTTTRTAFQTGISNAGGLMAVSPDGTQLFASSNTGSSAWDLLSINPANGMATTIGSTGYEVDAGLFVGGTLYGFDISADQIVTLNTMTGAGTAVQTYLLPGGDSITSAALIMSQSVPEPSGLVLGAIGTLIAVSGGLMRHHRRTDATGA
jgi:hypothetical protein